MGKLELSLISTAATQEIGVVRKMKVRSCYVKFLDEYLRKSVGVFNKIESETVHCTLIAGYSNYRCPSDIYHCSCFWKKFTYKVCIVDTAVVSNFIPFYRCQSGFTSS